MPLRDFFFGSFGSELLLLSLAQHGERNFGAVRDGLQELSQLTWLNKNLVIQHFQDVVLLNAGSSRRAVRLDVIDDQPQAFPQSKLITLDSWHLRCLHALVCLRTLRRCVMM